jgi:hypothetical protein
VIRSYALDSQCSSIRSEDRFAIFHEDPRMKLLNG